ncbi:DUF5829 family protein [Aquimarina sp. ERC-38]|uniref:DUF5829 family protein n=1 Tax=Aquimarina sp. ERC-38 TaxID=2949996 RepID=UPI002247D1EB|nr:DUF5829 family protein [Aquimarina sp. ERC-38]UZO80709.1 DUF5829 family protein [Aquimarina sp. ERC-38]
MIVRITVITLFIISLISCQNKNQKEYDPSFIDRRKLDSMLTSDVSKILLDHLYIVVDSATYQSLTKNKQWRKTYAAMDMGLPDFAPPKENATSCYLRGHKHYIEILGPNNSYNEPVGKSGIGFSLENEGEHFHLGVKPKLRVEQDAFLYATETVKMPLVNDEPTWFKAFYTPSPGTSLHTWYGFYNPGFLDHLHKEQHTSYTREKFLENTYKDHKLFNGIQTIQLTCTPTDFQRIANELAYLKCELIQREQNVYTIKSGDIHLVIEYSDQVEYSRISKITCDLNKKDNSVNHLGNLTITNQDKVSVWDFDQIHQNQIIEQ